MNDRMRCDNMPSDFSSALVTGGAGFIGSHLVGRLLQEGFEVTVLDDLSSGLLENLAAHQKKRGFGFLRGDIRDKAVAKKALRDVEVVFHEAAFVGGPQSVQEPLLTNDVNVNGTLTLLAASLKSDVKRFVFASSAAIYGDQKTLPVPESVTPHPSSPYAASKLAAEYYLEACHRAYGLETVSLRYFNVYGPGQKYGPYAAVITAFVNLLVEGKSPTIYGTGDQTRDFVHVADVVDANMLATEKNCAGDVFNIATGSQLTVNALFGILTNLTGRNGAAPIHAKARASEIHASCGDCRKAKEILGFEPRVPLKTGLRQLVELQMKKSRISNLASESSD
jgi:nucleoside-diphosphate-sugar epimerase